MTFTYASLFSGIGGFEQALNKLGGKCIFASEIDKFAAQAYEVLYGHKPAGDITKIDAKDIPNHDLLVAGFPCQAFSVAGKRKGFEDTRGTLFFEIARIAKEKRPKALLLENVKGLVNHDKGRTLDIMIKTLNEIGYVVDFEILNSKYFGVPQNRERIFIVAIREDLIEQEPWIIKGNTIVPKGKRRISEYEWAKTFNFDWPEQTEVTTKLRDILENNVDERYYLSEEKTAKLVAQLEKKDEDTIIKRDGHGYHEFNKITPTLAANAGTGGNNMPFILDTKPKDAFRVYDETCPTLQANDYKEPKQVVEPQMVGHIDLKGHDATTMGGGHRETKIAEEVRPVLTPDRLNKRQNGRRFKEDGEEMFTLTAQDRHGIAIREATKKGYTIAEEGDSVNIQFPNSKTRRGRVGKQIANTLEASGINQGVVESPPKYRIRKLTPLECWRLQGFPDEAHEAVKAAGISDSQRYKQAGNAVTVNVVEAISKRLIPLIS